MKHWLWKLIPILGVAAVAAGGYFAMHYMPLTKDRSEGEPLPGSTEKKNDQVVLSESKFGAAGIQVASVERHVLQPTRTVPGRIDYNATRHVALKSPADGLVRTMAVIVGRNVEAGQLLAIVDSPELGERRADVLQQQANLELARRERDWWRSVETNLEELLALLKRPQEMASLEEQFADKTLGDYRRDILSAYSKFRTADIISASLKSVTTGAVSQRMILEQASVRDSAAATFQAAWEQAKFDVKQKVGKADAVFDDASRRLAVARQRLTWLTGQGQDQTGETATEETLSTWPVKAPFAATVEEIMVAAAERVRQGDDILLIADTTRLWVQADIRDRDWSALTLEAGQTIHVQTPALPEKTLSAKIAFIGRTVNPETRAAPLVADIDNDHRLLRPGMFVRVLLPDGKPRETVAVPESAVVRHEGRTFVFIATGPREFLARDITTGLSVEPWVEITKGLTTEDRIVVNGAFHLKSELLLEPEE